MVLTHKEAIARINLALIDEDTIYEALMDDNQTALARMQLIMLLGEIKAFCAATEPL